jgi:hypothetical protein
MNIILGASQENYQETLTTMEKNGFVFIVISTEKNRKIRYA